MLALSKSSLMSLPKDEDIDSFNASCNKGDKDLCDKRILMHIDDKIVLNFFQKNPKKEIFYKKV